MSERAIIRLIYFFLFIPATWMSCIWLWRMICDAAGVTPQRVRNYRMKHRGSIYPQKKIYSWMVSHSKEPEKLKRLMLLYQIFTLPSKLCFSLSIFACFTHVLDAFLDYAALVLAVMPFAFGLMGIICSRIGSSRHL